MQFRVTCRERNVFVGPNNAGKSSVLDALRIFADVARYSETRLPVLKSQVSKGVCATYELFNRNFSIPVEKVHTNNTDADTRISITHENGSVLHIVLNLNRQPNVFIQSERKAKKTRNFFKECFPENIIVVPTLGQFEEVEEPNDPKYVERIEHTRLAARNFRNIWRQKNKNDFDSFSSLVSSNWKGVTVEPPRIIVGIPSIFEMSYVEDGNTREISSAGFGFQAWLQIMTHFLRGNGNDILVLDEPDIYLHADLQRRLYSIARKRFSQIFIATHSAEIMNEANSGDVVLVRPEFQTGKRLTTEEGYRTAHTLLGSSENADFARLSRARRIIAFEGNDRSIYRRMEQLVLPEGGVFSDPDTVFLKVGGYEQWPRVGNLPWAFKELFGLEPKIAAIFDRDYRCIQEIEEHEKILRDANVFGHVLRRKEIENYLVVVEAIASAVQRAGQKKGKSISAHWVTEIIEELSLSMRDDCLINGQSSTSKYFQMKRDSRDTKTILKMAKEQFDADWVSGFFVRVSGKEFLASLNTRLQDEWGFSVSLFQILDELTLSDLDPDMVSVINGINAYFVE